VSVLDLIYGYRFPRGYQRLQKGKLENIEGVIRRYQKETKAVNGRTDNAMSKCLEMSKGKPFGIFGSLHWYLQISPLVFSDYPHCIF
jgi:hypothetical protein